MRGKGDVNRLQACSQRKHRGRGAYRRGHRGRSVEVDSCPDYCRNNYDDGGNQPGTQLPDVSLDAVKPVAHLFLYSLYPADPRRDVSCHNISNAYFLTLEKYTALCNVTRTRWIRLFGPDICMLCKSMIICALYNPDLTFRQHFCYNCLT